jgi:hypothetical protein
MVSIASSASTHLLWRFRVSAPLAEATDQQHVRDMTMAAGDSGWPKAHGTSNSARRRQAWNLKFPVTVYEGLHLFPKGMGILVALSSFCFRPSQQQQRPYGQCQQQWDVQVQIVQEHVDMQVK